MEYVTILFLVLIMSFSFDRGYEISLKKTQGAFASYILLLIIFIVFAAVRDVSIGADTTNYLRDYNDTPSLEYIKSKIESSRYQPFWIFTVGLTKSYLNDFNWLLAVESLFLNIVVFRFFWKFSKYPFLCIALYFCTVYIGLNFETLREGFAVALCLLAYEQLTKKKYIFSFMFWICAFEFHVSAIISLLYPLLKNISYSKAKWNVTLIVASVLLLVFPLLSSYVKDLELFFAMYSDNLADRLATYGNTEYDTTLNIYYYTALIFKWILLPFLALYIMKERTKYFGFIIAYVFLGILEAFSEGFGRFGNYYMFFFIIFLADLCKYIFRKSGGLKPIGIVFFVLIVMYLNEYLLFRDPTIMERYYPYKSILF